MTGAEHAAPLLRSNAKFNIYVSMRFAERQRAHLNLFNRKRRNFTWYFGGWPINQQRISGTSNKFPHSFIDPLICKYCSRLPCQLCNRYIKIFHGIHKTLLIFCILHGILPLWALENTPYLLVCMYQLQQGQRMV
ncbi:hypothetical protein DCO45_08535 [Comamonas sp. JNW]|nr:hypothetical protein DCO45_08535 [Comamonas sp. JNW]